MEMMEHRQSELFRVVTWVENGVGPGLRHLHDDAVGVQEARVKESDP